MDNFKVGTGVKFQAEGLHYEPCYVPPCFGVLNISCE